uniref:S-acyltransferase n=1 Tax=Physcomitrium patens TaxID=3218 RepID=A0A2K1K610_PHYPA|nr:probable protein S-acyltransferase 22 isoform X2 [Physcomitrium patens]PNR49213.1 hypothetical protein PHYPA_011109 [Physcomitrium patens]|eukprot:XP_024383416.1 probable protein S-acyltransferase 22 isoform X2 [Physcomitrella patens]
MFSSWKGNVEIVVSGQISTWRVRASCLKTFRNLRLQSLCKILTVAVAVFSGLSFSFYVFFIPFVGSSVLKFHIYAAFSPVVLAVFILYVRCAGCDPADPGVHKSKHAARANQRAALKAKELSLSNIDTCFEHPNEDSDRNPSSVKASKNEEPSPSAGAPCLYFPFACFKRDDSETLAIGEQLLYCSICEAEISKNSKHCRACDKCVYEFDHHCRWLNNCVGRRNYRTFVSLMVACLLLLVIVWTTGIGVLVRCFSQKAIFEKEIIHSLGSSFSRVPYIIVVVLLSLLAMLGTVPLGQLFFFHLILIHKGITTYDYILAVREQGIEQEITEGDGFNSLTSSPASSNATGISGYSSAGALALHKGVFCTPPRMFVEHQQVMAFSGDLESSGAKVSVKGIGAAAPQTYRKVSVGINPWKLARMNAEEATKAATQARENSTILRSIIHSKDPSQVIEAEDSSLESSHNVSGEITLAGNRRNRRKHHDLAYLTGKERWLSMKDRLGKNVLTHSRPGILTASYVSNGSPQSLVLPRALDARNGFRCSPSRFSGEMRVFYPGSSYPGSSYPGSQLTSPEIFQGSPDLRTIRKPALDVERPAPIAKKKSSIEKLLHRAHNDGYDASTGESGDENCGHDLQGLIQSLKSSSLDTSVVNPSEKVSVWEDGSQEKFKPRTSLGSRSLGSRGSRSSGRDSTEGSSGSRVEANILKHVRKEWPELRDRLSLSPDDNCVMFPSPFDCQILDSLEPIPTKAITTRNMVSGDTSLTPGELGPTKKLKESLIMGKKSNKRWGKLSETTGWDARD